MLRIAAHLQAALSACPVGVAVFVSNSVGRGKGQEGENMSPIIRAVWRLPKRKLRNDRELWSGKNLS